MLKLKKCARDLKTMAKPRAIFGTYDSHNLHKSKGLEINNLDVIQALLDSNKEIDFRKQYGVDYDDFIYDDKNPQDFEWKDKTSDNTYNWSSQVTLNYNQIFVNDRELIAIKFHRYGDVRGNYTDYCIFDMSLDDFHYLLDEVIKSMTVTIRGIDYEISQSADREGCKFEIYTSEGGYVSDDAYLEIDNYRSKREVTKALREYLKNQQEAVA